MLFYVCASFSFKFLNLCVQLVVFLKTKEPESYMGVPKGKESNRT